MITRIYEGMLTLLKARLHRFRKASVHRFTKSVYTDLRWHVYTCFWKRACTGLRRRD